LQGIERQVALLDALSASPEGQLSITRLCQATGLAHGTAHRLLQGLAGPGIVVQDGGTRRWRLGPRLAFWAGRYLEGPAAHTSLRGFVGDLSRSTGFFAYLTVLDGGELVCVAIERPWHKPQFFAQLGGRLPPLSTAGGKALLAYQPSEVVDPIVRRAVASQDGVLSGPVTVESYQAELVQVRRLGYATCAEELEIGVSAVSAPVLGADRRSVASLTVVAPTAALRERWEASVERVRTIAARASAMCGGTAGAGL
jgi:DNA-binding IclR family transcriptional regulator